MFREWVIRKDFSQYSFFNQIGAKERRKFGNVVAVPHQILHLRVVIRPAGADHVVVDKGEIAQELRNIFPDGVSNALEIVGAATVKDTLKCVTNWGAVTVIGLLSGPPILEKFNLMGDLPNTVNLSFFSSGILGTEKLPLNEAPLNLIAAQIEKGLMPSHLAHTFNVDEIRQAHQLLDSNRASGKIVVSF